MLKKYLPNKETIKSNRYLGAILRKVGDKEYLWDFKQRNVVIATFCGVFWAMMPMPFQMIPAAVFAILFHANILVAIAWVWISNPVTMLPIIYMSYYLGCKIIAIPPLVSLSAINLSSLFSDWQNIVKPLLIGSVIVGFISAVVMSCIVWAVFELRKIIKR